MSRSKLQVLAVIVLATMLVVVGMRLRASAHSAALSLDQVVLHESDLSGQVTWMEKGSAEDTSAADMGKFVGLSLQDLVEAKAVYFAVCMGSGSNCGPGAIAEGVYRYRTEEAAASAVKGVDGSHLGLSTPILDREEFSPEGVKGQIIKARDPAGKAFWFVGRRGNMVMVVVTVGTGGGDQENLLRTELPVLAKRLMEAQ